MNTVDINTNKGGCEPPQGCFLFFFSGWVGVAFGVADCCLDSVGLGVVVVLAGWRLGWLMVPWLVVVS